MKPLKWPLIAFALATFFALPPLSFSETEEEFDRLDGKGSSGKRVDVIEWEGNFEIHVYPKGSLAGLALKLDQRNKNKPVMVIGYRFNGNSKKQLIRRAIVGIPFTDKFKAFRDAREPDFDKIVISNNTLAGDLVAYNLDPEPTQLYPDDPNAKKKVAENEPPAPPKAGTEKKASKDEKPATPTSIPESMREPSSAGTQNEEGTIKPFQW